MASSHGDAVLGGTHTVHGTGPAAHGVTHHVAPASLYWVVFGALMVFLIATVGAAFWDVQAHVGIPGLNILIALTIAVVKATLVVMYFMHVKGNTRLTVIWAAAGFIWLILMFSMISTDYIARRGIYGEAAPTGWEQPTSATTPDTLR